MNWRTAADIVADILSGDLGCPFSWSEPVLDYHGNMSMELLIDGGFETGIYFTDKFWDEMINAAFARDQLRLSPEFESVPKFDPIEELVLLFHRELDIQ